MSTYHLHPDNRVFYSKTFPKSEEELVYAEQNDARFPDVNSDVWTVNLPLLGRIHYCFEQPKNKRDYGQYHISIEFAKVWPAEHYLSIWFVPFHTQHFDISGKESIYVVLKPRTYDLSVIDKETIIQTSTAIELCKLGNCCSLRC